MRKIHLSSSRLAVVAIFVLAIILWSSSAHTPNLPTPPLRELAKQRGIELGNYASLKKLREKPYTDILTSQYSFVTIDGEPNWAFNDGSLRPSPGSFNFKNVDKVFNFAREQHMPVQMHHLVWGEEKWLPDWLKNGHYTPTQLMQLIHLHIQTVASRYRGQVREWTVVNEPFTRAQHVFGLKDWWADHSGGWAYIDQSFIWAHEADPNAKLLLNDFGNERPDSVSDAMHAYVKGMLQRHIPIDGIGMQMHIDGSRPPKKEEIVRNMQRFGALGIKVYVTEFDVNMTDTQGTQDQKDQIEAGIYYTVTRACIESRVCPSFAELGITDKESWYNNLGLKNPNPLPFDNKYKPKPAFYSLRQALSEE